MTGVALLLLAQAGAPAPAPSAEDVQAALPAIDGGCLQGVNRRTGRSFDVCSQFRGTVTRVDCQPATDADAGGFLCRYTARFEDIRQFLQGYFEQRADLLSRTGDSTAPWRIAREVEHPRQYR